MLKKYCTFVSVNVELVAYNVILMENAENP